MNTHPLFAKHRQAHGFTLVELMITVVIIGILAAIAVPSYQNHVRKGRRASAQAEMMGIANQEQQYLMANRSYADATTLGYSIPSNLANFYTVTVTPTAATTTSPPGYVINFTAQNGQLADGNLSLNNYGVKLPANKW